MAEVEPRTHNARLSYSAGGATHVAKIRVPRIEIDWQVNATETHARQRRAFYPHRRTQGGFTVIMETIHYREYNQLNQWLRRYARVALGAGTTLDSVVPPPMQVSVPSRNFNRLGYPTKGIVHGDHIGSMVFSSAIQFISVVDPDDPQSGIVSTSDVSGADLSLVQPQVLDWFYPSSINYTAANVQAGVLYGDVPPPEPPDSALDLGDYPVVNPDNPRQTTS